MFVFANFLSALAWVVDMALTIYIYIIIARALISWVNPDPYNPIVQFLYQVTEPLLDRIRRFLPFMGGIDISPIIAIFLIYFLKYFFLMTLSDLAARLKYGGAL